MVVVDTNVYVSALVFGGLPQAALTKALRQPYQLAVSDILKEEFTQTLSRKFGWSAAKIETAQQYLWLDAVWYTPVLVRASRDPNDDHVLGCAIAAGAQVIVTGDKDLLDLHPFRNIDIVTSAQFVTVFGSEWQGAKP